MRLSSSLTFAISLLVGVVALESPSVADGPKHSAVENQARKAELNGKTIRAITISVREIFDDPAATSFYRTANSLKISTHERVVRRELLFHEGDSYDELLVEESVRNLRILGYLANIEVVPKVDGNSVDLEVRCQDTWTFIPEFAYSSGTGNKNLAAGVAESDFLGLGKRAEFLYRQQDSRRGIEGVYDDDHLWDTNTSFVGGVFKRTDGHREVFDLGKPFRSLSQTDSWSVGGDVLDTVGRRFEGGSESYIYRQKKSDFSGRYTVAMGDPETRVRRIAIGYDYSDGRFAQADSGDYSDLSLDPRYVSNDPALLPQNRRFSGPVFAYQMIEPDYISLDYIDRFERVQDYNLGDTFSVDAQISPELLGSEHDALIFNSNRAHGWRFGDRTFLRAEVGLNSRYSQGEFQNTLARGELKFYKSYLPYFWNDLFLGRHTLAANLFLDYGDRLDGDREFLAGADNLLRGYQANTFSGDKRIGLNLEDRIHLVDDLYKLVSVGGAIFYDAGAASTDPLGTILNHDLYSDVGVGLRLAFPRSSGGRVVRIDLAFPMRDGPDGSSAWQLRVVFQGGQLFGSALRSEALGAERSNIQVGIDN